jgi:hypothetical protein
MKIMRVYKLTLALSFAKERITIMLSGQTARTRAHGEQNIQTSPTLWVMNSFRKRKGIKERVQIFLGF